VRLIRCVSLAPLNDAILTVEHDDNLRRHRQFIPDRGPQQREKPEDTRDIPALVTAGDPCGKAKDRTPQQGMAIHHQQGNIRHADLHRFSAR